MSFWDIIGYLVIAWIIYLICTRKKRAQKRAMAEETVRKTNESLVDFSVFIIQQATHFFPFVDSNGVSFGVFGDTLYAQVFISDDSDYSLGNLRDYLSQFSDQFYGWEISDKHVQYAFDRKPEGSWAQFEQDVWKKLKLKDAKWLRTESHFFATYIYPD